MFTIFQFRYMNPDVNILVSINNIISGGLKPKPWYLNVVSFKLKYVITQVRPNPKWKMV